MLNSAKRIGLLLPVIFLVGLASLEAAPQTGANQSQPDEWTVEIGHGGKAKLGAWSPIFLTYPDHFSPRSFEVTALDGNGLPVRYSGELLRVNSTSAQAWVKLGRSIGSVSLALLDVKSQTVARKEINLEQSAQLDIVESTKPMILCIESGDVIAASIAPVQAQLFGTECEIVSINDAQKLPLRELSYQGIRAIYFSMSDQSLVQSISKPQWSAIESWVADGGKLVLSLGPNTTQWASENEVLSKLIPGTVNGTFEITNSIQFERFARSKPPQLLKRGDEPILATRLEKTQGKVELAIGRKPLVVRKAHGFGQVVCATVDFDQPRLTQWNGHKKFLMRLTNGQLNLNRTTDTSESRNIVTYGYRDILGQLVFPLENFSRVSFINFTVVAVLIALFILCIGPGDYFLLKQTVGRMEWTWITFTLLAAAFCGLSVYISRTTKPARIQVNQLEIIDIDQTSDRVRGNIWTNIYSPQNSKNNISAPAKNSLGIDTDNATVCWMGIPGSGLGGMKSKTAAGLQLLQYDCEFYGDLTGSQINQLPIKVSSTKSLFTQYQNVQDFAVKSRLSLRRDRLQGTFKNPFDFPLEDCRIVVDNWTYVLELPLGPGDTVDVGSEMKEKTTTSYFSRRVNTETDKGGSQPWNPEESDMNRIAEMMMFFEAGGGQPYTRLTHQFRPQIDLSETLSLGRAVFYGRLDKACTQLNLESDAGECDYDQSRTYIRIVLPVQDQSTPSQR